MHLLRRHSTCVRLAGGFAPLCIVGKPSSSRHADVMRGCEATDWAFVPEPPA